MKFEYLIWVIIILVYAVSVIIKKGRAASETGEKGIAKRPPAWKEKLDQFMSQVQQMARQEDAPEDLGRIRTETADERIKAAVEEPSLPEPKPVVVKARAERINPAVAGKGTPSNDLEFGIQDLRKAVIWSEILAPPLALRKREGIL